MDVFLSLTEGNSDPSEQHFDLCFGGRRHFCANDYADLGEKGCEITLCRLYFE